MPPRHIVPAALLVLGLSLAGCAAPAEEQPTDSAPPAIAPTATAAPAMSDAPTVSSAPSPAAPAEPTTPAPTLDQAWATASLTDVASGEDFRIADLAGTTVIIEPMAIWCTNCRAQQRDVQEAFERLGPDAFRYVVLDVDPNETADALADYQVRNEFRGTYAIAGQDVARALAAEFGDQVLNPPSTPMIVIGTDGRVTFAEFGHKSVDRLVELATEHGA